MSEPENFLSRWSRRKHDAAQGADEIAESADDRAREAEPAPEGQHPQAEAKPAAAASKPAELPFDPKDLPPIESITAATDLRPFLQPGVPAELARAALRRAWVTDPTIRNFVGLAEYAWDYHEPGSMGGFGSLEMTDELRQVVARIIGGTPDEGRPGLGPGGQSPLLEARPIQKSDVVSSTSPAVPPEVTDDRLGSGEDQSVDRQDVAYGPEPAAPPAREHTAVQQQKTEQAVRHEIIPSIVRRSHGGALPK